MSTWSATATATVSSPASQSGAPLEADNSKRHTPSKENHFHHTTHTHTHTERERERRREGREREKGDLLLSSPVRKWSEDCDPSSEDTVRRGNGVLSMGRREDTLWRRIFYRWRRWTHPTLQRKQYRPHVSQRNHRSPCRSLPHAHTNTTPIQEAGFEKKDHMMTADKSPSKISAENKDTR